MLVCANRHGGEMYASRIRIKDRESLVGHDIEVCRECEDRPCVEACPTEAISVDDKTGAVKVDSSECNACQECIEACHYGAINYVDDVATICDLCGGEPGCVTACPEEALVIEED